MPARRHLRLRATRRLGTTRNTRGFIFAIASTARFRGSCGRKKTVENCRTLDKGSTAAIRRSRNKGTAQRLYKSKRDLM